MSVTKATILSIVNVLLSFGVMLWQNLFIIFGRRRRLLTELETKEVNLLLPRKVFVIEQQLLKCALSAVDGFHLLLIQLWKCSGQHVTSLKAAETIAVQMALIQAQLEEMESGREANGWYAMEEKVVGQRSG
ncbi:hypothetical protein ACH5RR_021715 [Cinchona calisaya]|uniref:Uncharacterized protein n=1 Tax=Cinchona calisaya TaxID=153742 RepID=A0ABD2ZI26_9GENT